MNRMWKFQCKLIAAPIYHLSIYLSIYLYCDTLISEYYAQGCLEVQESQDISGYACETTGSTRRQPDHIPRTYWQINASQDRKYFVAGEARTRTKMLCGSESEDRRSILEPRRVPTFIADQLPFCYEVSHRGKTLCHY